MAPKLVFPAALSYPALKFRRKSVKRYLESGSNYLETPKRFNALPTDTSLRAFVSRYVAQKIFKT